jgi:hypothetical protein
MYANRCYNFRRKNVIKKEAEKTVKYKHLAIETQCMLNVKTSVTPVIIEATGSISKQCRKYLSNVQGKYEMKKLQKTHTLRKVLM